MQFDTTINDWHTCPNTGRINASNPCSEYMHLDDSACNLASLNLMRFIDDDGIFDTAAFRHAVDIAITAQDIVIEKSSYPTAEITANAHAFRELGLGYANLGALLMSLGLPYDPIRPRIRRRRDGGQAARRPRSARSPARSARTRVCRNREPRSTSRRAPQHAYR
jgi:hypothetical protein